MLFLHKKFNKTDLRQGMVIDTDFGLGVQYVDSENNIKDSSIKQNVIKYKLGTELMGEELRVLYVALTRAMEKMIISGSCKDVDKALEKNKDNPNFLDIRSCNSYQDMILLSFDNVNFDIRKYDYTMLLKEEKRGETITYSDYKKVGNLLMPFRIEATSPKKDSDYVMIFSKIELNKAFKDDTFKF